MINYFSNQIIENDSNETKLVSPGELVVNDLLRGGVLYNLVGLSFIIKFKVVLLFF